MSQLRLCCPVVLSKACLQVGSGPLHINLLSITDHLKAHSQRCSLVKVDWLQACQSTSQALPPGEFGISPKALLQRPPGGTAPAPVPPGGTVGVQGDPSGSHMGGDAENSQSQFQTSRALEGCWFTLTGAGAVTESE